MKTSDAGLRFIADWEGLRLKMYDDGGKGIGNCTIGVGHLVHLGPCDGRASEAPFRNGITNDAAFELMRKDVQRFEDVVNRLARVPLNQNQFDALVDFSFNTGGYYPELWATINAGGDVCAVLLRTAILPAWATQALQRRRRAECKLYMTPSGPVQEERDDEMIRMNGIAKNFEGVDKPPGNHVIDIEYDFPQVPKGVKGVLLDVFLDPASKGTMLIFDGDGTSYAGEAGLPYQMRAQVPVFMAALPERQGARGVKYRVLNAPVRINRIGLAGYMP
jgi:lysozyme